MPQHQYAPVSIHSRDIISHMFSSQYTIKPPYTQMVAGLKRKFQAFFYSPIDQWLGHLALNQKIEVRILVGLMNKEEDIYKSIYDFIKEWGPEMAASELSAIVHMADKLSKEEIVLRCVAIRNALWDLEE